MSAGTNNVNARGMATGATAVVYDFNNSDSELAEDISNQETPLLFSNNSWGTSAGWDDVAGVWRGDVGISEVEDWKFGFYDGRAARYDEASFNNPFFTIIKSSGNDNGDNGDGPQPADGPFDIIATWGVAKNIITVGAIRKFNAPYEGPEDVQIAGFSSTGPADDGRIKPDIVGVGVSVLSTSGGSDTGYANLQGTSMSAPHVTGTLVLLQQLYSKLHGEFMKSASVKALAIHTAYETGDADGPDYIYGWGLINAEAAARMLLEENGVNKRMSELSLNNGETMELTINPVVGTKVKATIVWTDPAGTPVATQLDPEDLMLVNDLDMRIASESTTHSPWILDPSNPTLTATTGDNFRDNVEQVAFTAEEAEYTLTINHKGDLENGSQDFTLVIEYERADGANTYYWTGGGGDWSDLANWELVNGEPAQSLPGAQDNVLFNDGSFSAGGDTPVLSIDGTIEVGSVRWFTNAEANLDLNGGNLIVNGDFVLSDGAPAFSNGQITFRNNGDLANNVSVANADAIVATPVVLDGNKGAVNFTSDINFGSLTATNSSFSIASITSSIDQLALTGSNLNASGTNLTVTNLNATNSDLDVSGGMLNIGEFTFGGTEANALNLQSALVNISTSYDLTNANTSLSDTDAIYVIASGETATFSTADVDHSGDLQVAGTATLSGNAGLRKIAVTGSLTTSDSFAADSISLSAGSALDIAAGTEITLAQGLEALGEAGNMINLTTTGSNSSINIVGHIRTCLDFVDMTNVNFTGDGAATAGANSTLSNTNGWQNVACDDVLFADFSFQYGCVNSVVFFNDLSSGNIQTWSWSFHDGGSSDAQNPLRSYAETGTFDVGLVINDGTATNEYDQQITIVENNLPENDISANGDVLISRRGAIMHQWFRDNVLIPGATGQTYDTQGEQGTYFVLTFDETCNRISLPFELRVTSIDEDQIEQEKLDESINVFPNPANDYLDVKIEGYDIRNLQLTLVDPSGKLLATETHDRVNSSSFERRLDVSGRTDGFYILRFVVNEDIQVNRKVILAR